MGYLKSPADCRCAQSNLSNHNFYGNNKKKQNQNRIQYLYCVHICIYVYMYGIHKSVDVYSAYNVLCNIERTAKKVGATEIQFEMWRNESVLFPFKFYHFPFGQYQSIL